MSRSVKNSAVYGGGRAASARLAGVPQMPTTHDARPAIMPKPTDMSIGPSARNAAPSEKRLVKNWGVGGRRPPPSSEACRVPDLRRRAPNHRRHGLRLGCE